MIDEWPLGVMPFYIEPSQVRLCRVCNEGPFHEDQMIKADGDWFCSTACKDYWVESDADTIPLPG